MPRRHPTVRPILALFALLGGLGAALPAYAADAPVATAPVDYAAPASWLCRPGAEEACTAGLDAMVVGADGSRVRQAFAAAKDPPIDCFYVYPTTSREESDYADMAATPEVVHTANAQAGRLASRCRLFVPLYRQLTLAGLHHKLAGDAPHFDRGMPYDDVLAAWRRYLAHDNKGRGVVLVGHSQGTILLQRLIAEEIDGKPAQKLLVAAFLAGDPGLPVPAGKAVGGLLRQIPLCAAAAQTGCVYVWGSYAADAGAGDGDRLFGRSPGNGLVAGCVSPAAPGGGRGMLEAYLPRPAFAPDSDPAWIEAVGQLSGTCTADAQGDVLRVVVEPSRFAGLLGDMVTKVGAKPGWGLHVLDINLVEGNMLDTIDAETRAWTAR